MAKNGEYGNEVHSEDPRKREGKDQALIARSSFLIQVRLIAFGMVLIFCWDQIVFAEGVGPYESYQVQSVPSAADVVNAGRDMIPSPASTNTTTDFLLNSESPLSPAQNASSLTDLQKIYDSNGRLRIELSPDEHAIRHVYENEWIQQAIDQAATGDTVFVHGGTYHEHLILKQGVDLKGEDPKTTIIQGDYEMGLSVIRALGNNRIENMTISGARDGANGSVGAIAIEGDKVKVRGNRINLNLSAGVYVAAQVENVLIEENSFWGTNIAVKDPKNSNVIRYNTITGFAEEAVVMIKRLSYLPGKGFRMEISDSGENYSYFIEYSDDFGATWKRAKQKISSSVFEDQFVLVDPSKTTAWIDDGTTTDRNPLDVSVRLYRVRIAESFTGKIGIEISEGEAPSIQNNIIAHQTTQSIWEEAASSSQGFALVEGNVLFHDREIGDASGRHLPPAISSPAAGAWAGGNMLADPGFVDPSHDDYAISENSPAFSCGAFLPQALSQALDRASTFNVANTMQLLMNNGSIEGYRIVYEEGSHEEFYTNGAMALDRTPPEITFVSEGFVNAPEYELVYAVDGVEKSELLQLREGLNHLTLEAEDIFGNKTSKSVAVILDQTPPSGMLRINAGDKETDSRAAVLYVQADDASPLIDIRISLDGGTSWTYWEKFNPMKVVMLSEGEGDKEVLCQVRDAAGNVGSFSETIRLVVAPVRPTVDFFSESVTEDSRYTLRYAVNGEEKQEFWQLQPGENRLLVCASSGGLPAFEEYVVTLNQQEKILPPMPGIPTLPQDVVSLTTANGLILKYWNDRIMAIEKPGEYTLFSPEFDTDNDLAVGVLLFSNGDKLLYQNGEPIYRLSSQGEKTVYNNDGTVAYVMIDEFNKIRFDYRQDGTGKVISILSFEEGVSSLYDEKGRPVWIEKSDGTAIFYQDGFLKSFADGTGNVFSYEISPLSEGTQLLGYLSKLISVTRAGTSTPLPLEAILEDLSNFPSIKNTLGGDLSCTIEYDPTGAIRKVVSGSGEVLELQDGLPVSFVNASGELLTVKNQISEDRDLFSMTLGGDEIEQVYDSQGRLSAIGLKDGSVFQVTGSTLHQISLNDGSFLTNLAWDGNQLTGFTRIKQDGSKEAYWDSKIIYCEDAEGNVTGFLNDRPNKIHTEDGRTYTISEYSNSQGVTERLTELAAISWPDGSRMEFSHGVPVRYTYNAFAQIEPEDLPEFEEGRFFIPQIDLNDAQLRALTVDQNGTIFSGQILFPDGTQYFIEDDKIVKQVTATGQMMKFSEETLPPVQIQPSIPAEPLSGVEIAYRDRLVEAQWDYFMDGKGLHAGTGLPVDNYIGPSERQSDYSQATLVGFWAEILASIAAGDHATGKMSRQEAFEKLRALLMTYREVQKQVGWNGMVAFFKIVENQEPVLDGSGIPTGQTQTVYRYENCFNQYGFGDALNLALSLASVIGALEAMDLEPDLRGYRDTIVSCANEILPAQEAGYAAFYDPVKKRFHGAYGLDAGTRQWKFINNYYIDRVFNEFRTGMIWLAAKYPQYQEALKNLDVAIRPFETREGDTIDIATPYDGGAFQMFWPLIHVDETQYPEFEVALRNFLYAQAEFVAANGIPGLLSAGDMPLQGYQGKIGLPGAAETDDLLRTDIGSVYGTASAFPLAPHYTLQFLKNMEAFFPGMRTGAGFVDAIQLEQAIRQDPKTGQPMTVTEPLYSDQYYGVDQASFILSLLNTSQKYFKNYLERAGVRSSFDALYQGLSFKLSPSVRTIPQAPDFGQEQVLLFDGPDSTPDGLSAALIKQEAFVPVLMDSEWGEGHIYNYLTPSGKFHHIEIEFGEGKDLRRINLQEYCLSQKHAGSATALLGGLQRDILNGASSQGVFYTPGYGTSISMLAMDPGVGEVRHLNFQFRSAETPVGIWANYNSLDLSEYDFLSVPVKLAPGTPENVRLKFEFKGMGEVFLTGALSYDWQYISIPIPKPAGPINQLAISIQPLDGNPVAGDLYLGALSALKVRTSNEIVWELLLGRTGAEIRTLIQQKILVQTHNGSDYAQQEILENFTVDSDGKLVNGVLKRADGGIQYFQKGKLVKWVFRNGRTILFENGLATFVIDLARGKLETGRFYYDQSFRGEIRSFIVQDNDSKKNFDENGQLKTLVEDGYFVNYEQGQIHSIQTDQATLTDLTFADDGNLAKAHVSLVGGGGFDIDQTGTQGTDLGGGVKVFYYNNRISAIETPQNGKTHFIYYFDSSGNDLTNAFVQFPETVTDPQTGTSKTVYQFMNLSEYLQRPERVIEKTHILEEPPVNVLERADAVDGFSVGALPAGEITRASKGDFEGGALVRYQFNYQDLNGPVLGMSASHIATPVSVEDYDFLTLTIKKDPSMDWNQTLQLTLKTPEQTSLYSFQVDATKSDYQTFEFPLAYKAGLEGEVTLEVLRQPAGVGKTGAFFIKDISYLVLKKTNHPLWEVPVGILASKLKSLRIASAQLTSVGAEIASKAPIVYAKLAGLLDIPTVLHYKNTSEGSDELVDFNRLDGTQVELEGENVRRVILSDGTVNEYEASQNSSHGTIEGPGGTLGEGGTISYSYGALRKIIQTNGREYLLSYEFDVDGKEITVFKDVLSGEERRFKDGKLLSAIDPDQLQTRYAYEDGELTGAQMMYNNRVLNSTRYSFNENGTQVEDERGTTWFYDANGDLIRHLTRDGYLYEYSDYTQAPDPGASFSGEDLQSRLFTATGLRAVNLIGYEASDGSQVLYDLKRNGTGEVNLAGSGHGVNISFDADQNIKSGQIQFPEGLILEIENYVPIRGRFEDGQLFSIDLPQAETYELLKDEQNRWAGFKLKIGERFFSYDNTGRLTKTESEIGISDAFSYSTDAGGFVTGYAHLERSQIAFNGVPFPKEVSLVADATQKLLDDSGREIARHEGAGFLAGIYKVGPDQWDLCPGSFGSAGDRAMLKNFLSGIKPGESIAMSVSDVSFSQAESEILTLLEGLGAGQIRQAAASNSKWTFFGRQGLGMGKGSEKTGVSDFSTVAEKAETVSVAVGRDPLFLNTPMLLNIPSGVSQAYEKFLARFQEINAPQDMQATTVYDAQGQIVFTNRIDGMKAYYDFGKIRETYNAEGELVAVHEYECWVTDGCDDPEDAVLKKITLVKARSDFEVESQRLLQQIEQTKFDALYRLAGQDEAARLQIKESVESGAAQISSQIAALQAQRFRKVKTCRSFIFWKTCHEDTFEVPGVQSAINQMAVQRSELVAIGEMQLAGIPGSVASKKLEIEQATAEKTQELEDKKQEFLQDILRQEVEPILTDFFRRILGRDASKQEFEDWVNRSKGVGQLNTEALRHELQNSPEKATREIQKAVIVQEVQDFLEGYLMAAPETKRQQLLALNLNPSEAVNLTREDADKILEWLRSRDLHFGQSAFLSLKEMLASKDVEVPMEVIAKETILIDVLTGVIHKFSEGDLLISLFALDRAAGIHSQDFTAVQYTFDDLRSIYHSLCGGSSSLCGLRMVAHIGEDHFVVLENVTETGVTYRETGKGSAGESVTVTKEQFLKVWVVEDNAGYLLISEEQAILDKKLSDQEAMKIRGAFWFIFFFVASLVLTAASMVVSIFSPTFGKFLGYAALVAGIIGIVAGLGSFIVQGMRAVFSSIVQQGVFATIKQGFLYAGKMLWDSVSYVGRFFQSGFVFLKECFTGGLNAIGSGLICIKNFLLAPAQAIIKNGVPAGYEFSFAQNAARQLVAAGLMIGVSKGLEGLGLDSRLAQLAGAFVGGGFLGLGSATSSFIRSGLQHLAMQGVSEIALRMGLAPPFANVVSLVTTQSLAAFFDPNLTLKSGLLQIAPQIASQFTMGGLELISRSLGLNPRLAQLLGSPIAAITGNIVGSFLGSGSINFNPSGIFDSIKDAILSRETLGGVLSLSAEFLMDQWGLDESLLGSFSSRIVAGLFGDFIASPTRFSIVDSLIKSVDESIYHSLEPVKLVELFDSICKLGFEEGIEQYAISLFTRETLQEFTGAGESLSQWIERGMPVADDIIYEGESAKLLKLAKNGKTINFIYVPNGTRLEIRAIYEEYSDGRRPRFIRWEVDAAGRITQVIVEERMPDGTVRRDLLDPNGRVREILFRDWSGEIYGRLSVNASGAIEFTHYQLGISNYLTADGRFTFDFSIAPDLQDLNQLFYDFNANLSPESVAQLVGFTFGNGFWNTHQLPDAVPGWMMDFINDLTADQARSGTPGIVLFDASGNMARDRHGNILTTGSLPVTLYEETGLVGNVFRWMADTWFGCNFMRDEIERELVNYFDLIELNQREFGLDPNMKFTHFAHSGNFQPMIEALEHMPDAYRSRIKTLVVYEGPYVGDGVINDPFLQTLIRVRGVKSGVAVPFLEHREFQVTDTNGKVTALQNQYNIEISGADHSDFSYDPSFEYASPEAREIARKTSLFMRELALKANDFTETANFLDVNRQDGSVELVDGIYRVDILKFKSELDDEN